jgi:hypothetical protein
MKSTTEELLDAALALPAGDRLEFAEALVASLRPEDRPPFDESCRRRSAQLVSGDVKPVPWPEVKRQAREKADG